MDHLERKVFPGEGYQPTQSARRMVWWAMMCWVCVSASFRPSPLKNRGYQLGESSVFWPSMGESTLGNPDLIWGDFSQDRCRFRFGYVRRSADAASRFLQGEEKRYSHSAQHHSVDDGYLSVGTSLVISERLIIRVWMHCWRCAILPRADSSTRCAVILLSRAMKSSRTMNLVLPIPI